MPRTRFIQAASSASPALAACSTPYEFHFFSFSGGFFFFCFVQFQIFSQAHSSYSPEKQKIWRKLGPSSIS